MCGRLPVQWCAAIPPHPHRASKMARQRASSFKVPLAARNRQRQRSCILTTWGGARTGTAQATDARESRGGCLSYPEPRHRFEAQHRRGAHPPPPAVPQHPRQTNIMQKDCAPSKMMPLTARIQGWAASAPRLQMANSTVSGGSTPKWAPHGGRRQGCAHRIPWTPSGRLHATSRPSSAHILPHEHRRVLRADGHGARHAPPSHAILNEASISLDEATAVAVLCDLQT